MKILIIGSKGFIGSNAFSFFGARGYEVWGCGVSECPEELNYFQVDRHAPDYNNIFKLQKFDICINASGSPGVSFSIEHPFDDFRMNVSNAYALLNAIRLYNPQCKFINLSSAAVYGNPVSLPIKEESILLPLSPYGYHKMLTEQLVSEFYHIYKLSACSFRIFSAYGPGIKKQLLWDIYQKAINATDGVVTLFGNGNETRDFIYIQDVLTALQTAFDNIEFNGQVYNLGSGTETSIKDIATLFLNIINPSLSLQFNGVQKAGDPLYWRADMQKLTLFNLKTEVSIEEGLNLYHQWLIEEEKK